MVATLFAVPVQATGKVKISKSTATIYVGETLSLKVYGTGKKVKWSTSNKKIATVSKKGKVTAKKKGNVTIKAKVGKKTYRCKITVKEKKKKTLAYGVFLSLNSSDIKKIKGYKNVVIDAQYFSRKDIATLKKQGSRVYSYINVGALENFREYYNDYSQLAIGTYENWEEEQWIDVSSSEWQEFLASLEEKLLNKGVDGFFVDNCDVYYEYPREDIFDGLTIILKHLMESGKDVIINGGDTYVMTYLERYGSLSNIMTGVNQECVWSNINFETKTFSAKSKKEREYFKKYVETCKKCGLEVYLLEYTKDSNLKRKIKNYCNKNKFYYYISDSIELD